SRRRHTRSKRDWSSDVCSSDLVLLHLAAVLANTEAAARLFMTGHRKTVSIAPGLAEIDLAEGGGAQKLETERQHITGQTETAGRSEERRGGRECRHRREG